MRNSDIAEDRMTSAKAAVCLDILVCRNCSKKGGRGCNVPSGATWQVRGRLRLDAAKALMMLLAKYHLEGRNFLSP